MATKSKMGKCRTIFDNLTGAGKSRKDIIAKFVSQAGATPAGAATYYQKLKNPPVAKTVKAKPAKAAKTSKKTVGEVPSTPAAAAQAPAAPAPAAAPGTEAPAVQQ